MKVEQLLKMTESMPMKTIMVNEQPYLQRYFAGYTEDGGQWWYHRFLRSDSERHLHSHPWEGRALVLRGGYKEQSRGPSSDCTDGRNDHFRYYRVGHYNMIYEQTLHRIVDVEPETWTLIYVKAGRLPQWFFVDDDGKKQYMDSSPENWNESCKPRDAQ